MLFSLQQRHRFFVSLKQKFHFSQSPPAGIVFAPRSFQCEPKRFRCFDGSVKFLGLGFHGVF